MDITSLVASEKDVRRVLDVAQSPRVAVVLGSGLGGLADLVQDPVVIPFAELEGIPALGGVPGHRDQLVCGSLEGVPVVVFKGRVHQYQGATALEAAYPARLAAALGCETLILTNASGGISKLLGTGDIVLISDHINLMGTNPLIGARWPEGGTLFVGMRDAYDPQLRALAFAAAEEESVALHEGIYASLLGPSYETPAEVEHLRRGGADVVGMSTVPEAIAARALGLRVLAISLVANDAASEGLSHEEVLEAGRVAAADLTRLMLAILRKL
jgi:purine-nucleoside phosphorylase